MSTTTRRHALWLVASMFFVLLALLMAASAVFAKPGQTTTETFNTTQFVSFTVDNPCPGYEEPILFEGVHHQVTHVTQIGDPSQPDTWDIRQVIVRGNLANVTGTGQVTGDEYRFVNPGGLMEISFTPEVTPEGIAFTGTETIQYLIVSDGASPNFMLHVTVKAVVSQDGEAITKFEHVRTSCTGSGGQTSLPTAA